MYLRGAETCFLDKILQHWGSRSDGRFGGTESPIGMPGHQSLSVGVLILTSLPLRHCHDHQQHHPPGVERVRMEADLHQNALCGCRGRSVDVSICRDILDLADEIKAELVNAAEDLSATALADRITVNTGNVRITEDTSLQSIAGARGRYSLVSTEREALP